MKVLVRSHYRGEDEIIDLSHWIYRNLNESTTQLLLALLVDRMVELEAVQLEEITAIVKEANKEIEVPFA